MTGSNSYFNSLSLSYSSATGTAGTVTSNTQRGNLLIPLGSSTGTVNNSLVTPDTYVNAIASTNNTNNPVMYIECSSGSFTLYLQGNAASDIYIKWIIVN
jgi:hypothetical protein